MSDIVIVHDVNPSVVEVQAEPVHIHLNDTSDVSFLATAGETLNGGDLVCIKAGKAVKLETATEADYGLKAGFAVNSAVLDGPVRVQYAGVFHKPGWGLTPDATYWATGTGQITNAVTTEILILNVGAAIEADKLIIHFGTSYIRL